MQLVINIISILAEVVFVDCDVPLRGIDWKAIRNPEPKARRVIGLRWEMLKAVMDGDQKRMHQIARQAAYARVVSINPSTGEKSIQAWYQGGLPVN